MALVLPKKISISTKHVFLMIIIMIQVFVLLWFGNQKNGLFMDEIASYGLSNNYYVPFIQSDWQYRNFWHEPQYFANYIEAQSGELFRYDSVWYNQTQDVHPPLYYILLHTVCSFFPNSFNKWYGFGLNIFLFVSTIYLLYYLANKIFGDSWFSVLPCIFYGFSAAAVSTVLLTRMYILLSFFFIWAVCIVIKAYRTEKLDRKFIAEIILATFLGVLTQYYFLIFMFFLTAICCIILCFQKRWKFLIGYGASVLGGLLLGIICFPSMILHIFGGYRGTEAMQNFLGESNFRNAITEYWRIVKQLLIGEVVIPIFAVVLVVWFVVLLVKTFMHKLSFNSWWAEDKKCIYSMATILISSILFVAVVAKISPAQTGRYIYSIFPILAIIIIWAFQYFLSGILNKYRIIPLAVSFLIVIFSIKSNLNITNMEYLYVGESSTALKYAEKYDDLNCIYFYETAEYESYSNYLELLDYKSTLITSCNSQDIDRIPEFISQLSDSVNEIIVFLPDNQALGENINKVSINSSFYNYEELYKFQGKVVYHFFA